MRSLIAVIFLVLSQPLAAPAQIDRVSKRSEEDDVVGRVQHHEWVGFAPCLGEELRSHMGAR